MQPELKQKQVGSVKKDKQSLKWVINSHTGLDPLSKVPGEMALPFGHMDTRCLFLEQSMANMWVDGGVGVLDNSF